jgi:antitoxin MazE
MLLSIRIRQFSASRFAFSLLESWIRNAPQGNRPFCIYWLIQRFAMAKTATLRLQRWGNSLAVRIPSSVARSAGFRVGLPVEVSARDSAVLVAAAGEPRLTLGQKLALFDPERHGGEAMATARIGSEAV